MIVDLDIRFLLWQEMFMSRAWRIECEGAPYRVLSLGNEGHGIFFDDDDRHLLMTTLGQMAEHVVVDV